MPLSLPLPPHLPPSNGPNVSSHGAGPRQSNAPNFNTQVKMPTPPWIRGPLIIPTDQIIDFSKKPRRDRSRKSDDCDRSLTEKVRGGRSRHAVKRIVQSITKLQELDGPDVVEKHPGQEAEFQFEVPLEDGGLGWSGGRRRVPWTRSEKLVFPRMKKEKVPTKAELSLPEAELARLRAESVKIREWVNVRKIGVSSDVVEEMRKRWRRSELVRLKFDLPLSRNMDRAQEIVETKTSGLVVWRRRYTLVVYRGHNYQAHSNFSPPYSCLASGKKIASLNSKDHATVFEDGAAEDARGTDENSPSTGLVMGINDGGGMMDRTLFEREGDRLLDGLGPRFIDWWYPKPLPVDADLLPEVVQGFKPPFRLCLPRIRPKLTDDELTYLRKLARPLPTHFVLGRNRKLQGLAAAILKLWEKSIIVKIAVKWGIPNTNNKQMAWELKHLTGGVLLLRNKFFIIFYRGKDFLPHGVANTIAERETELKIQQLAEEDARLKAAESFSFFKQTPPTTNTSGTFSEFHDIQTKSVQTMDENWETKVQVEAEKDRLEKELRKQERKLFILKAKTEKSEKQLAKLNSKWSPADPASDQEILTVEEKQIFRNIGWKMDETLSLGRRGVYDGIIESIHQHWKHREVVKVVTMQKAFSQIINAAALLEIESGGILVCVEKFRKGHAIIIYRGKNYKRPLKKLPENLLNKKEALQRSIEMQRRGCLRYFACQRQQTIWELQHKLRKLEDRSKELDERKI